VFQHAGDFVGALLLDVEIAKVAKRDVQDGAIFRGVDVISGKHLVPEGLDLGLAGERKEDVEDGLGDQVFGVVQEEGDGRIILRRVFFGELGKSRRILGKEIFEDEVGMLGVVDVLQLVPGGVVCVGCLMDGIELVEVDLPDAGFPDMAVCGGIQVGDLINLSNEHHARASATLPAFSRRRRPRPRLFS
jgi:hypothetical protein